MMTATTYPILQLVLASGILLAGVVDDLKTRKFHNWLFLTCSAIAFITIFILAGPQGLIRASLGFFSGFFILLPLVMLKIVGGGDLKLMAAFGAATDWNAVLMVSVYALFWGGLFGLIRIVVAKQAPAFARNMMQIVLFKSTKGIEVHTIPYTVALAFGWVTYLITGGLV